jgi:hypothetical protein
MTDTLFPLPPPEKKRKAPRPKTAADVASKDTPLFQVTVGTTHYFLRANDEKDAVYLWLFRYGSRGHTEQDCVVKRLLHADIAELIRIDPRLATRLARL